MKSTRSPSLISKHRRRGLAPLMLVGGMAAVGVGTAYWQQDWRIERTTDKLVCGIKKGQIQLQGEPVPTKSRLTTEAEACVALIDKDSHDCPLISSTSIATCKGLKVDRADQLDKRMLLSLGAEAPLTQETDWWTNAKAKGNLLAVGTLAKAWPSAASALGEWTASFPPNSLFASLMKSYDARPLARRGTVCQTDRSLMEKSYHLSGYKECLAAAVAPNSFVTAAHCLPADMSTVSVKCGKDGVVLAACKFAASKAELGKCKPGDAAASGVCAMDIARCTLEPNASTCLAELGGNAPHWKIPKSTKELFIVSLGGDFCRVKLDAMVSVYWPPLGKDKQFMRAKFKHPPNASTQPPELIQGDSGAAVFDSADKKTRRLIGINTHDSLVGGDALIAPLYLYEVELNGAPAPAPQ